MQPIDIESVISDSGAAIAPGTTAALRRFLVEIARWNERVGLVSRRSPTAVLTRLVRQSASLWQELQRMGIAGEGTRLVDIGSGNGFPGIMCKLMDPTIELLLVERREKKATFLQRTCITLGLANADVFAGSAADAGRRWGPSFDIATAVAVAGPAALADDVVPLLAPGGHFAVARNRAGDDTPREIGNVMRLVERADMAGATLAVYRCI